MPRAPETPAPKPRCGCLDEPTRANTRCGLSVTDRRDSDPGDLRPLELLTVRLHIMIAIAPRAVAALGGRFLPRLGPLAHCKWPFFFFGWLLFAQHSSVRPRAQPRPHHDHRAVAGPAEVTALYGELGVRNAPRVRQGPCLRYVATIDTARGPRTLY